MFLEEPRLNQSKDCLLRRSVSGPRIGIWNYLLYGAPNNASNGSNEAERPDPTRRRFGDSPSAVFPEPDSSIVATDRACKRPHPSGTEHRFPGDDEFGGRHAWFVSCPAHVVDPAF
jgi:hypothetical protein